MPEVLHSQTPLIESFTMKEKLGCPVRLKMECFQAVGSFKIRGIGHLCQEYAAQGIQHFVSSSGGNAGYAAAYVGRLLGVKVTVFVPSTTNQWFIDQIRSQKATVKIKGEVWDEAHEAALDFNAKVQGGYIPPFDHPSIWAGHSSLVDELYKQCPKPSSIVVSVGGGGLLCGILQGLYRVAWQDVPIIAVETEGAASLAACMKAQEWVELDTINTVATSLGAKRIAEQCYEWTKKHPITSITVSDKAAVRACRYFVDDFRVLVEPACGAALSVIYDKHPALLQCDDVLVIVCGGIGISLSLLEKYMQQFSLGALIPS